MSVSYIRPPAPVVLFREERADNRRLGLFSPLRNAEIGRVHHRIPGSGCPKMIALRKPRGKRERVTRSVIRRFRVLLHLSCDFSSVF